MTLGTECVPPTDKQGLIFRRMGVMAGSAFPFRKRLVFNLASGLQVCYSVAGIAQAAPLLQALKGFL